MSAEDLPEPTLNSPIADWTIFRVLKVGAFSLAVIGPVVGAIGWCIDDDVTTRATNVVFLVCVVAAIVLGIVCIFFKRACPKCGRTMIRVSPARNDYRTSYKYVCPDCKVYIDTFLALGRD